MRLPQAWSGSNIFDCGGWPSEMREEDENVLPTYMDGMMQTGANSLTRMLCRQHLWFPCVKSSSGVKQNSTEQQLQLLYFIKFGFIVCDPKKISLFVLEIVNNSSIMSWYTATFTNTTLKCIVLDRVRYQGLNSFWIIFHLVWNFFFL